MTAPKGTVLEVLYIDGDRYTHRDSNWYWVLLPGDQWGSRLTGWIRGDEIEHVQPPQRAAAAKANLADMSPRTLDARNEPREEAMPAPAPVDEAPAARPFVSDVVLNFEFDKSTLTDEARLKLDSAVVRPPSNARSIAVVALEGYADWIGREAYNDQLGLARAETVKRYLTEQLGIPAERITVVSYGEGNPVAPNTTRAGRAQNRRVVIKGGGS